MDFNELSICFYQYLADFRLGENSEEHKKLELFTFFGKVDLSEIKNNYLPEDVVLAVLSVAPTM